MFEGCTIKYKKLDGIKTCIQVIYPQDSNGTKRILSVPLNPNNTDYQKIQEWVDAGNTIAEE